MTTATNHLSPRPAGRIERALSRRFMRRTTVVESKQLADRFRLITLVGDALRDVAWIPGAKVQVQLGGWVYRTYTPLSWNSTAGSTQLLLHTHGVGPGAAWSRNVDAGDTCWLFGPRSSLDLISLERPALVFGDETSIGLVHALRSCPAGVDDVMAILEVSDTAAARVALEFLGLDKVQLVERQPGDAHLHDLEAQLRTAALSGCVLSGKATSIQRVNKQVRQLGLTSRQIRTKAYWAPGKTGLD